MNIQKYHLSLDNESIFNKCTELYSSDNFELEYSPILIDAVHNFHMLENQPHTWEEFSPLVRLLNSCQPLLLHEVGSISWTEAVVLRPTITLEPQSLFASITHYMMLHTLHWSFVLTISGRLMNLFMATVSYFQNILYIVFKYKKAIMLGVQ